MQIRSLLKRNYTAAAFACVCLAVTLNSCSSSKEAVPPPTGEKKAITSTVKILSLNLRHTLKEHADVRKLSKQIKSSGAEIVAVQQIEQPAEGKSGFDAVKDLAKQTEMYQFFGKARYLDGFDSGNALFSMYPVRQTAVSSLPVGKGKVRRSLAFGIVDVGIKSVGVGSTELDDQSSSERVSQAQEIHSIALTYTDVPLVVCGNFWEPLSGKAAQKMQERFVAANALQEATVSNEEHIYAGKGQKLEPLSVEKIKFGGGVEGVLVTMQVTQ